MDMNRVRNIQQIELKDVLAFYQAQLLDEGAMSTTIFLRGSKASN